MVSQFGYTAEEVTGRPVMDFIVPEDRFDILGRMEEIHQGNAKPYVFRITSGDGKVIWIRGSSRPIFENGQFAGIRGVMTDFTNRKKIEEALKASEGHYRGIFENAPMGIFHSTMEGQLVDVNPAFARMFGYDSPEDVVGTVNPKGGTVILYDEPEKRADCIRQVSDSGGWQSFEVRFRKKDGSLFTGTLTFRLYENPDSRAELEGFVVDITGSRKAQARLAASEQRYHNVFASASDAMLVTDPDTGAILDANKAALALYQYTLDEFRGLKYPDLSAPAPDEGSAVRGGFVPASCHRKKDGTVFPVEVTKSTYPQKNRTICISSVRDITGRKEAEERILATRRLYMVLSRVSEAIVRVRDLETLLHEICRIAVEYGHFRMVWVGLIDKEKQLISPVAHAGFEDGYLAALHIPLDATPEGSGPTGSAFRSGVPTITADIAQVCQFIHMSYRKGKLSRPNFLSGKPI